MTKIYNRSTKEYFETKDSFSLRFLYKSLPGRLILKGITHSAISKINGKILSSKISKIIIKKFIQKNNIDMNDYPKEDYKSFNHFFVRKIIPSKRIISTANNDLISPADSKLMVYNITEENKILVKNSIYTVLELIQDNRLAKEYQGGLCLVFRLSVEDYHHYVYIDDGESSKGTHISGILHTVNPIAYKRYRVFKENSREYTVLKTKNFGKVVQIEVGALNVGKICNRQVKVFNKGDEKGYFEFGGSTIILLIKKDEVIIDNDIIINSQKEIETIVKLGEVIGKKNKA